MPTLCLGSAWCGLLLKRRKKKMVWKFERNPHRTFPKVAAWNVLTTRALQPAGQRTLVHNIWNSIPFLSATLIFSFHPIYFSGFVFGKNTIVVFSVEMLLHLFGSFSGSSPCLPHLPATAQPVVLVQNQGNKFMRGKNAAITKAACFHLHFPRWVVIITPFPPSCGIYILAQARCCFVRHHEQIWTKALESFLGA